MTGYFPQLTDIEWRTTFQPELGPREIHIWKVTLDDWIDRLDNFFELLSESEIKQAKRFRFNHLRIRYATVHASLRLILSKYLHQAPSDIRFLTAPGGKPGLEQSSQPFQKPITFNISHSDELLLVSLTAYPQIGIDVEKIKPEFQFSLVSDHFFAPQEQAWIAEFPLESQQTAFYRLWTCKEAVLKGEGSGMGRDLEKVKIDFEDGMGAARSVLAGSPFENQSWSIRLFMPAPGYTAALAYSIDASAAYSPSLKFFEWMG